MAEKGTPQKEGDCRDTESNSYGKKKSFLEKVKYAATNITVEPFLFLITLADTMDEVAIKDMLIYKSCKWDFNQTDHVCDNLLTPENEAINEEVQNEYAQFQVYQDLVSKIVPMVMAFYFGAWCDIFGRKYILYLSCGSRIMSQAITVLNAVFLTWRKEYFLLVSVPPALTGGIIGYTAAISAFLADISSPEQLAVRLAILSLAELIARPVGTGVGAILIAYSTTVVNTSLSLCFLILASFMLWWRIHETKWQPQRKKMNYREAFHPRVAWTCVKTLFKSRPGNNRMFLFLAIGTRMMARATVAGKNVISYIYTRERYSWDGVHFSNYKTATLVVKVVAQLMLIPTIKSKKLNEVLVLSVLVTLRLARDILEAFADYSWMFYLAALFDSCNNLVFAILKAMMAACVPLNEAGKIFCIWSFIDMLLLIGTAQTYKEIWAATQNTTVGAVYLVSAGFTLGALLVTAYFMVKLRGRSLSEVTGTKETRKAEQAENKMEPVEEKEKIKEDN